MAISCPAVVRGRHRCLKSLLRRQLCNPRSFQPCKLGMQASLRAFASCKPPPQAIQDATQLLNVQVTACAAMDLRRGGQSVFHTMIPAATARGLR